MKKIRYKKALVILGPTTTGKTEIALEIAMRMRGELINADKFYLFSGFPSATELPDFSKYPKVPRHLYEILEPGTERLLIPDYVYSVKELVREILDRKNLPIIEGCSFGYANALVREREKFGEEYGPIIGLKWTSDEYLRGKVKKRIEELFSERKVIQEVENALDGGYRDTYVMQKGVIIAPIVELLDRKISEAETKEKIYIGILEAAYSALRKFLDIPKVHWIERNSKGFEETLSKIEELIMKENA